MKRTSISPLHRDDPFENLLVENRNACEIKNIDCGFCQINNNKQYRKCLKNWDRIGGTQPCELVKESTYNYYMEIFGGFDG